MADVDERGQILLIGAVVIAVIVVALSLLLSSGLHAETATRDAASDVSADQTRTLLTELRSDGTWLVQRATSAHPNDVGEQERYVQDNVTTLGEQYRRYYAHSDSAVTVEFDGIETGTTVTQSSGTLDYDTDGDGTREEDWTVASNTRVRNATVTVDGGSGATTVVFDDGDTYAVEIDAGGTVSVDRPSGTTTCTASGSTFTVDLGNATVDGEACPALAFDHAIQAPYDVRIEDGDQVTGSYRLTADGSATGPNTATQLYAVDLSVTHRTSRIDYEGTVSIAPEEL